MKLSRSETSNFGKVYQYTVQTPAEKESTGNYRMKSFRLLQVKT
jgi:hypothetical protein